MRPTRDMAQNTEESENMTIEERITPATEPSVVFIPEPHPSIQSETAHSSGVLYSATISLHSTAQHSELESMNETTMPRNNDNGNGNQNNQGSEGITSRSQEAGPSSSVRAPSIRVPDMQTPSIRASNMQTPSTRDPDTHTPSIGDLEETILKRVPYRHTPSTRTPDSPTPPTRDPDKQTPSIRPIDMEVPSIRDPDTEDAPGRAPDAAETRMKV